VSPQELWRFLPVGYLLTIAIETPILLLGLSRHHPKQATLARGHLADCVYLSDRHTCAAALLVNQSRAVFLLVAELFAPVAECVLFWLAFGKEAKWRDFAVIVIANLASFLAGELFNAFVWARIFTD
jgi:hypothetical protein